MSKVKYFLIFACSFVLASCGSTDTAVKSAKSVKNAPDWVISGISAEYPKSDYLTGIGSAKEKRSAEIDAINELVSIFGQNITSAAAASRRMAMAQSAGVVASSDSSALGQDILREVNQNDVIAVEVPEFYELKSENNWYALAVMNREKGTRLYTNMIQKNQSEINSILKQISSDKEPNTMLNFSRLDFCEEVAKVNDGYLNRLRVLNPRSAEQFDSISTPVQIHKMKADMAAKIPVCVSVSDDSDGRIAKSFQEVMSASGFNTTLGSNERYRISCTVHFTQGASGDGKTQFCEYAAECALIDTFSGETLVPLEVSGREGSPTYQNAQIRAKQKIAAKVKSEFAENFQKYLGDFSAF